MTWIGKSYIIENNNYKEDGKITIQEQIKTALIHADITQKELSGKIGMSPQSFVNRLKTGKFTKEELEKIGSAMGAEYHSYFLFPDGNKY